MLNELKADADSKMKKTVSSLKHHFGTVRSGKANIHMLDDITVEYYGTETPLNQVATLATPEAQLIVIQPFEKQLAGEIVKAIQKSNLGFNPQSDGQVVRVPVPALSEERRKDMVKLVSKIAEEARVAVRNIRRDMIDQLRKGEKDGDLSEDARRNGEIDAQELTDTYIEEIDKVTKLKEEEVMAV
jgi:ribosome recycling factor